MARKKAAFDFEQSIAELQQLVEQLESGEPSLEESLLGFERGIALTRACQSALQQAEQKVSLLLEDPEGNPVHSPFESDASA